MNFTNLIYLLTGIGLGVGFGKLLLQNHHSSSAIVEATKDANPPQQEVAEISTAELAQTKLAYEMAREMSQFQAGFLARTSHELRSPLNGLIGLHQLIINDLCEDADEEKEFVNQAYNRALKLLEMIDEILSVARTEHGKDQLEIKSIKLKDIFEEVYKLTHMLAANRNYPFHISFPDADIYIAADFRWLRQILVNLIDNAILQMEEGSIYLSAHVELLESKKDLIYIYLDIPQNAIISHEPVDLIASPEVINQEEPQLSSGMKLLLNQKLLTVMGGKLEVISSPNTQEVAENSTRLQISIPSGTPEVELLPG
ncbi:MAG: HAMP domain-containing histidine kinase [Sphaerospermopsis sp. SIO1G1]|nr:HAMP domain-containing histidine kinase [Sphaerospermopsis sp. SIO1G1]